MNWRNGKLLGYGVLLALAMTCLSGGTQAQAQGPFLGGIGCGGWGVNYPYGLYGSRVEDVPYFALFPPVYYSMPVPRTYGWSPFAYPPGTMTPEIEAPLPKEIINPYVPQPEAKPSSNSTPKDTMKTASTGAQRLPKVIINPYVNPLRTASVQ